MTPLSISLWKLLSYFFWLGSFGFGGPLSLVGYMRRDLVEKRHWVSREDFLNGLALVNLCPGPLATQLAMYIGWLHSRILGATLCFLAFTLPSFLIILGLAISYVHYGDLSWKSSFFYGISASTIAIILYHAYHLAKLIIARDYWIWVFFGVAILLSYFTHISVYWIFLGSSVIVWLIKAPPRISSSSPLIMPIFLTLNGISDHTVLLKLFLYLLWTGAVVFGGGYAIIPVIQEGIVQQHGWLTEQQFLDAVSIGMITPGPVILAVSFMGYLMAGITGSIVAAIGIFLPCYICILLFAPHFNRIAHHDGVKAFVQGLTVAVAGTILGSVLKLSKNAISDLPTVGIFIGTALGLYFFKKVPQPLWLLLAALIGIIIKGI